MEIERALERAMDCEDPGPAFAGRVVAAIKAGGAPATAEPLAPRRPGRVVWRALLPLAATVALSAAGLQWQARQAEEARARAAHDQLVQALRLTGEQLGVVHRAIERSQEQER
jgi:hypothetical protein